MTQSFHFTKYGVNQSINDICSPRDIQKYSPKSPKVRLWWCRYCWQCHQPGHSALECSAGLPQDKWCPRCLDSDHWEDECWVSPATPCTGPRTARLGCNSVVCSVLRPRPPPRRARHHGLPPAQAGHRHLRLALLQGLVPGKNCYKIRSAFVNMTTNMTGVAVRSRICSSGAGGTAPATPGCRSTRSCSARRTRTSTSGSRSSSTSDC